MSEKRIVEICNNIILVTKYLVDSLQSGKLEIETIQNGTNPNLTKPTALLSEATQLCNELYGTSPDTKKSDYKRLCDVVNIMPPLLNEFIESIKACCNNQYNFSLLQPLHSSFSKLSNAIQETIKLAELLASGNSVQIQELLNNAVKESVISIRKLSQMIDAGKSFVEFTETARNTFATLLNLKGIITNVDTISPEAVDRYGRLTTMLIQCSKEHFLYRDEPSVKKNFELVKQSIAKSIHEFLELSSSKQQSPQPQTHQQQLQHQQQQQSSQPQTPITPSQQDTPRYSDRSITNLPPSMSLSSALSAPNINILSSSAGNNIGGGGNNDNAGGGGNHHHPPQQGGLVSSSSSSSVLMKPALSNTAPTSKPIIKLHRSKKNQSMATGVVSSVDNKKRSSSIASSTGGGGGGGGGGSGSINPSISMMSSVGSSNSSSTNLSAISLQHTRSAPHGDISTSNSNIKKRSGSVVMNAFNEQSQQRVVKEQEHAGQHLISRSRSDNDSSTSKLYADALEVKGKNDMLLGLHKQQQPRLSDSSEYMKDSTILPSTPYLILQYLIEQFPGMDSMIKKDKMEIHKKISYLAFVAELQDRFLLSLPHFDTNELFEHVKNFGISISHLLAYSFSLIRNIKVDLAVNMNIIDSVRSFKMRLTDVLLTLQLLVKDGSNFKNVIGNHDQLLEVNVNVIETIQKVIDAKVDVKNDGILQSCKSNNINNIISAMKSQIWHLSSQIRLFTSRIITSICTIMTHTKASTIPSALIIEINAGAVSIVNVLSTFSYSIALLDELYSLSTSESISSPPPESGLEDILDIDMWSNYTETKFPTPIDEASLVAPLNVLIELLTSDIHYDANFMKSFICTYHSFTTPNQLFIKLKQRFQYPPFIQIQRGAAIQMRVCVVLKYWVQNQFQDFDDRMVNSLHEFLEKTVKDSGHTQLADIIIIQLLEKVKERQNMMDKRVNLPPMPIDLVECSLSSLTEIIFSFSPDVVAEQLTLIDFSIFKEIQPNELMNTAWSSNKLKWRAVNTNIIMERLNSISYWIATVILSFENLSLRVKAIEYFYQVAASLRKLNNYHSLMGFVVSFNISGITRMRYTIEATDNKLIRQFKAIEELMNPSLSFKNYRKQLNAMKLPCIPYLGVYLTDLVFIEDGNPDEISQKINFPKRELVYKTIQEIQVFQQSVYELPIVNPLYTLLKALPCLTDKQLHTLSLAREPRNAEKKDLL